MRGLSLFKLIAVMLLSTSLLNIFGNNVPILGSYRWLWSPILIIYLVLFYTKILEIKSVKLVLLYGILYVGVLQYTLWRFASGWYIERIYDDYYALVINVLLLAVLQSKQNYLLWNQLSRLGLLFIIITGLMTIVATQIDSYVVRASYSDEQFEMSNFATLKKLGFGTYGYMTAIVALLPILVYFYRTNSVKWLNRSKSRILIIFFVIVIISSQIFANILVSMVILSLALLGAKSFKRNIFLGIFLYFTFLMIPSSFWVSTILKTSQYFSPDDDIHYKLIELSDYYKFDKLTDDANTFGYRAERYPMLFRAFLSNPIFGDASYPSKHISEMTVGGHLYWMSRLALWGIFGFIGYLYFLFGIFRPVIKNFDFEYRFYFYLALLSIVILGFMKAIGGREPYIILLIIIPGLYPGNSQGAKFNRDNSS